MKFLIMTIIATACFTQGPDGGRHNGFVLARDVWWLFAMIGVSALAVRRDKKRANLPAVKTKTDSTTMKYITTLLAFIVSFTLNAATIAYTVNVPTTPTNWTNNIPLHQFNPTLGQLYKVHIGAEYSNHRKATFWSFATNNVTYEVAYTCDVKLLWPDATVLAEEVHTEWAAGTLGLSGATYTGELTNVGFFNTDSCVDFAPAKIGPLSWLGTGTLPFKAVMTGTIDLGVMDWNQIFPQFVTEGSISVTITYFYTPGITNPPTAFPCH